MRSLFLLLVFAAAGAPAFPAPASGQDAPLRPATEQVTYRNPEDGRGLSGVLTLPSGQGPFPGVVVLSVAGADPLVDRLTRLGYAVLLPERRGMTAPEQLLRATFQDLADDALAAMEYLRSRPEVDAQPVALIGHREESSSAILAAAGSSLPTVLVLVSPTGLPGIEAFRTEQLALAEARDYGPEALEALGLYLDRLTSIVVSDGTPGIRAARLRAFMEEAETELPRSASLPSNVEGQIHFFTSPWWWDRLTFQPEEALGRIRFPVLVVMGEEDPVTPDEPHLPPIRSGLEAAPTDDVTLRLLPSPTRHPLPPVVLDLIGEWLVDRIPPPGGP